MRKVFLLLILPLILCLNNSYAQLQGQARIDSMLLQLSKQKEDSNKVKLLNQLSGTYYLFEKRDIGIMYGKQGLALATNLNWQFGIALMNNVLGANYFGGGKNDSALNYFFKALDIYEALKNRQKIGASLENIGNVYAALDQHSKSMEFKLKALKISEETDSKTDIATSYNNISNEYIYDRDFFTALEYLFKALKLNEEAGDKKAMSQVCANIGVVYIYQKDYTNAMKYYTMASDISKSIGDQWAQIRRMQNICEVYSWQNDYTNGLEFCLKTLKILTDSNDNSGIGMANRCIGELYTAQKNYVMAISYGKEALRIAKTQKDVISTAYALNCLGNIYLLLAQDSLATTRTFQGNSEPMASQFMQDGTIPMNKKERLQLSITYLQAALDSAKVRKNDDVVIQIYERLARAYQLNGDYKKALDCTSSLKGINDSVMSKENSTRIMRLEMKNEFDRRAAHDQKIAELKYQRQKSFTYFGLAGILILSIFSIFIISERRKSELARKKSDELLLNILPAEIAEELKLTGRSEAKNFDNVTVLFTDFVNFTQTGVSMSPKKLLEELNACFKVFDEITTKYNIEKIKTIGDAYLAVAGLPKDDPKHAENIVKAAIEINAFMQDRIAKLGNSTFGIRIGIHSGSVVAGIVGIKKFAYDIWGDTVNTAARLEQHCEPSRINISETTYEFVKDKIKCEYRGEIAAKGKGMLKMYYVV